MRHKLIDLGSRMGAIGGRGADPGRATSRGRAALREPITGEETRSSHRRALP